MGSERFAECKDADREVPVIANSGLCFRVGSHSSAAHVYMPINTISVTERKDALLPYEGSRYTGLRYRSWSIPEKLSMSRLCLTRLTLR